MKYYLIAGEPSGDALGARLMQALRRQDLAAQFYGIGGDSMQAEGLESLFNIHTKHEGPELSIGYTARIIGRRLKIAGNEMETGIYLAPCADDGIYDNDSSTWTALGHENIVDNTNTNILFNIPNDIIAGKYRLILKTAYGSGSRINKSVRTGVYSEIVSIA